jgi:heterodisulfide reductase subunit A
LIHVSHNANITDVSGYVGSFVTTVSSEGQVKEIPHGIAILATGAQEYKPSEYLYGEDDRVMTQLELEGEIAKDDSKMTGAQSMVMIQCVGCRQEDKNYCSRVCCGQAVKNALKLKELKPEMDIHILFRDMRTYGFKEDYYREAANQDIKFIRYEPEQKPVVVTGTEEGRDVLKITVPDPVLGQNLELSADLLTLSAAVDPAESTKDVARLFKVSLNADGFFQEAHVKLRPVDFAAEGVFLCGTAQYPKHITETISQAYGAAGRAITVLSGDSVTASGAVCDVDENNCVACGACITACKYDAISFVDTPKGKKARVEPILCKGDGLCNAKCPTRAIYLKHYTDDEIFAQIDEAIPTRQKGHK